MPNINRRKFIVNTGLLTCGASIATGDLFAREKPRTTQHAALKDHRIDKVEYLSAADHYPRLVGRNARGGIHGQHHKVSCVKLYTDQGAMGWGRAKKRLKDKDLQKTVLGKKVNELIIPEKGIRDDAHRLLDPASINKHDLTGHIVRSLGCVYLTSIVSSFNC